MNFTVKPTTYPYVRPPIPLRTGLYFSTVFAII
jgi:hypothetical protein